MLAGSPARDGGDPDAEPNSNGIPETDQRGTGYARVFGNAIDIGAVEQLPDVFMVDTLVDESDGDTSTGDFSLREALELTNAKPGADIINFDSILSGNTISQSQGVLVISDDLTLSGPGADRLTLDALNNSRVLRIDEGATVFVGGLTLKRGSIGRGGGIRNDGIATLTGLAIVDNRATINASDAGGGIWNSGTLSIYDSLIASNTASNGNASGGGIWNEGSLLLVNSTISDNSTGAQGGGVASSGDVIIRHSTLADNSATQGGGVAQVAGTITADHSIIANNNASVGDDIFQAIIANWSLIEEVAGGTITGANNLTGVDPALGTLQDNGGAVSSYALQNGSPAIDAGNPSLQAGMGNTPSFDGRSSPFGRIAGTAVDIGAYEVMPTTYLVDTTTDINDGDFTDGQFSLREAIELTNAINGMDTISFDSSVFTVGNATITLAGGELVISDDLNIAGLDASILTIDGHDTSRIFQITDGKIGTLLTVSISGMRITDGRTLSSDATVNAGRGGAIHTYENLTLTGVWVDASRAASDGGGIWSRYADLTISDSTISGNTANFYGGGIYTRSGDILIVNSTISGNTLTAGNSGVTGGGVYSTGNNTTIEYSTISGNSSRRGGGISGVDSLLHTIVSNNTANVSPDVFGSVTANFSLVEDASGATINGNNNIVGVDPLLGVLTDNGGPTPTHALLNGSQAINAGDPNASGGANGVPLTDQRGLGFDRVVGAAIDIGAFEVQAAPVVTAITVNAGGTGAYQTQRSRITSIDVTFASPLSAANLTALQATGAITLINNELIGGAGTLLVQTGGANTTTEGVITVTGTAGSNTITLSFSGPTGVGTNAVEFGSLSDGRWRLDIAPASYSSATSATLPPPVGQQIRRLFGDINGDGTVDGATDFAQFGTVFGSTVGLGTAFDYNQDGTIDGSTDFAQFGSRFGRTI